MVRGLRDVRRELARVGGRWGCGVAGHGCQSLWEWYAWLLVGKVGTTTPVGRRDRVTIASDCGVGEGGHVVL